MNVSSLRHLRGMFLTVSLLGFLLLNMPFLYFIFFEKEVYTAALSNGVALVFMGEAFLLMLLFAFLIARLGWKRPGWVVFIVLSMVGSMAFSVPFYLFLYSRRASES